MHIHEQPLCNNYKRKSTFYRPFIPEIEWCDFRQEYESGSTLKEIAEKYFCDPRTVRRCITLNKSSTDLGRQTEPTKLAPYIELTNTLFQNITYPEKVTNKVTPTPYKPTRKLGICEISRIITQELQSHGYTGSERTVRNYLRNKYQYITDTQNNGIKKENNHASD